MQLGNNFQLWRAVAQNCNGANLVVDDLFVEELRSSKIDACFLIFWGVGEENYQACNQKKQNKTMKIPIEKWING